MACLERMINIKQSLTLFPPRWEQDVGEDAPQFSENGATPEDGHETPLHTAFPPRRPGGEDRLAM